MSAPDERTKTTNRCVDCGAILTRHGAPCPSCARATAGPLTATAAQTTPDGLASEPGARPVFTGPSRIASYRILRELGAGGMGTVFEAHDERMDRRVALKVMSRHQAPSEKSAQRFAQEAWIAGRLDHPHIVRVYERGEWEELSYYSMELVQGGSLAEVVGNMRRWGRDDRLGIEFGSADYMSWAIRTVADAARAIDYAHRQGVVHRDIKPMNILLSRETGVVKIADFGLAIDQDATRMTTAGKILGTLAYMAPEQILGKQQEIGVGVDVYALGVTLFELLTLALPFAGETHQVYMNAVLTAEARRPRKLNARVGRDLEVVIRKALEKNAKDRYASAAAFAEDLENVAHFRPILAHPPGPALRIVKWVRRRPIHAALIVVLAAALPTFAFLTDRALDQRRMARAQAIDDLWQQVRWHWQRGAYRELIEPTGAILEIDPDHLSALQTRSASYVALAAEAPDATRAAELQQAALGDIERLEASNRDSGWPIRLRAHALRTFGREQEAAAAEARAALRRSAEPNYYDLYFDADIAARSANDELAVNLLGDALVQRPQDLAALLQRALALERLGRLQEAIQDYRVAIALSPEDWVATYNLGRVLADAGLPEEGEKYLRRVLDQRPADPLVYQSLSDNALERGRAATSRGEHETARALFEQAEADARRSLDLAPDQAGPLLNLGASLMERNRLADTPDMTLIAEAIDHYERAREVLRRIPGGEALPEYSAALVNSCDALIQTRSLERALDTCTTVTQVVPHDAAAFYNLAGVHALLGRSDEALSALERDFALGDHDWRYLESDAWFESMRRHAGFRDLLSRMKQADEGH